MSIIPSRVHGVMDYLYAIMIAASPWIFNFNNDRAETIILLVIGFLVLIMSLLTNYELGLLKLIPFSIHLLLDLLIGIFVLASPWLFGFDERVFIPHIVFGLIAIITSSITKNDVYQSKHAY